MRAVDTNIVVRYLTGDDPGQIARVRGAIDAGYVYVSNTVLLETEWVLRRAYGYGPDEIVRGLRYLAGHPRIRVENAHLLAEALEHAERGMDFADALHLGAAAQCEAMLTFDRHFIRMAAGTTVRVEEP